MDFKNSFNNLLRKRFYSFIFLLFVMMGILLPTYAIQATEQNDFDEKRVLFISSYSSSFSTFYQQIEGINNVLENYPVIVDMEFMDSKRFYTEENLENFYQSLSYKIGIIDYDLVMVSDDNALEFTMDYRDELFIDLPIVFFGINNEENALLYSQDSLITGIIEDVSISETIQLAIDLEPNTTKILAISDNTNSGQADLIRFYEEEQNFEAYEFLDLDMSMMSLENFLSELTNVRNDTILILLSALRDIDNNNYEFSTSVEMLLDNTERPIYHLFEHGIGEGLLGGKIVSHHIQGQLAAEIVISIFSGEPVPQELAYSEDTNIFMIDYQAFSEFGFEENDLPEDTVFINGNLSFFQTYKTYVIATVFVIVFLTGVILVLSWSIHVRSKSRLNVLQSKNKLQKAVTELKEVNEELSYTVYHDFLTGLYNRRYFEEEFAKVDKVKNYPLSIILADVNGLKIINDAFGHISGDKALIETAKMLTKVFPESVISRIGGDEFAVLTTSKSRESVYEKMHETRTISNHIEIEGIILSLSLGYSIKESEKVSFKDMFTEAEDWMYREKLNKAPSNRSAFISTIIATINQKDVYSEVHSKRVSAISERIAVILNLDDKIIGDIKTAGLLHDIGKIIVPSRILNKAGKLTSKEYNEIKKHSEIGFRILSSITEMRDIAEYVFCHHERIDGKGYPRGLKGDEIPIQSKIISVADALDAMLTDRLYRLKLSKDECLQELLNNKGTQFSSKIVDAIVPRFDEIYDIVISML